MPLGDIALFIAVIIMGTALIILIYSRRSKEPSLKGSLVEALLPKWRRYYNGEKGSHGRLAGQYAVVEANEEEVHIFYQTGWFLTKRRVDEWVPKRALRFRNFGKDCAMPEGVLEVQPYSLARSPYELKPYIEYISEKRREFMLLREKYRSLLVIAKDDETRTVLFDQMIDIKHTMDQLTKPMQKPKEEPPLIETSEEKKEGKRIT